MWASRDRARYRQFDERYLPGCRVRGALQTEATLLPELCYVAAEGGHYSDGQRLGEASQAIYDQLGLAEYRVRLRRYRAIVLMRQGLLAEAEVSVGEMYQLLRSAAAKPARPGHTADLGYAMLHNCYAGLAIRQGDYALAAAKVAYGLELSGQLGKNDYVAMFLAQPGDAVYLLGQTSRAQQFWLDAAELERKPQVVGRAIPEALLRLTAYERLHGNPTKAMRLTHAVRRAYALTLGAAIPSFAPDGPIRSGDDPASLLLELLQDT